MIAAIAVENVELADGLELVFLEPHGEDAGDPRIEAGPEQGHQPRFLETIVIGPLPVIFEPGLVLGLVIRRIEIIDTPFETGIHYRQVLIGERQIDDQAGLDLADQIDHRRDFLGIDLVGRDIDAGALLHALCNGVAFRFRTACKVDVRKDFGVHRHLVDAHAADAARADYQDFRHS